MQREHASGFWAHTDGPSALGGGGRDPAAHGPSLENRRLWARAGSGHPSRSGRWGPLSPALSPLRQGKGDSSVVDAGGVVEVRGGHPGTTPNPLPAVRIAGYGPERALGSRAGPAAGVLYPRPYSENPRLWVRWGATPNPRPLPPCDGGRGDLVVAATDGDKKVRGGGALRKSRSRESRVASPPTKD